MRSAKMFPTLGQKFHHSYAFCDIFQIIQRKYNKYDMTS